VVVGSAPICSPISRAERPAPSRSEFKNYRHSLHERTLLIAISQSGETADLLEAVDVALARGSRMVAVVNVPGSMLTRKAHYTLLVQAGPEKPWPPPRRHLAR